LIFGGSDTVIVGYGLVDWVNYQLEY